MPKRGIEEVKGYQSRRQHIERAMVGEWHRRQLPATSKTTIPDGRLYGLQMRVSRPGSARPGRRGRGRAGRLPTGRPARSGRWRGRGGARERRPQNRQPSPRLLLADCQKVAPTRRSRCICDWIPALSLSWSARQIFQGLAVGATRCQPTSKHGRAVPSHPSSTSPPRPV